MSEGLPTAIAAVISDKMDLRFVSFAAWNDMMQSSFEQRFYVPTGTCSPGVRGDNCTAANHSLRGPRNFQRTTPDAQEDAAFGAVTDRVRRRGIYRDTVGATNKAADYQLRPNFLVAMVAVRRSSLRHHAVPAGVA